MAEELYLLDLEDESLTHYGVGPDDNPPGRGSGRYPKGSGENPYQHDDFYQKIQTLKREGLSDDEIAKVFKDEKGMNSSQFRAAKSAAVAEHKRQQAILAKEYSEMTDENGKKLYSNVEIGKMLGVPESTVRNYLKTDYVARTTKTLAVMDALRGLCTDTNYIDLGPGSEIALACSSDRLKHAAQILQDTEGYEIVYPRVKQMGTGMNTTLKVLCPPGTPREEVYANMDRVNYPSGHVELYPPDSSGPNITKFGLKPPTSVDSSRVMIRYAEEGGLDKDGVIEIRRGLDDLTLGNSNYAQVRIMVDNSHYLKGMCVYSDNMPEGKDIIFNTNKKKGTPMLDPNPDAKQVLKPLKNDPDNPFGATIKVGDQQEVNGIIKTGGQMEYRGKDGKLYLSPVNIVNEEGDWGGEKGWSKSIASQMLGKQAVPLIKRQLNLSYSNKVSDFEDIMMVDNPVVKKKLLEAFAESCDTAAVHLKAAPFPRQSWNVILPIPSLKEGEIFAPQYKNGETVCLIRYPHAGTFEIDQLTVNNKNAEGRNVIGLGSIDAVGVTKKTADKLSGADFDGDTVLVVPANSPTSNVRIRVSPSLEGLKDFEPKILYSERPGMTYMKKGNVQAEMGKISNLITDMNLKGATDAELARAVRHSMVVIDAYKHKLDYTRSYEENGIDELKKLYQKKEDGTYGGASTLLSRAKSQAYIPERKEGAYIIDPVTGNSVKKRYDPTTGEKLYSETGRTRKDLLVDENKKPILDENGKKQYIDTGVLATQKTTKMAIVKDARELSSGLEKEEVYASYANGLKALGNEARKAYMTVGSLKYSPEAKKEYEAEVKSLNDKLLIALKNAPRERQAQILANEIYKEKKLENPNMNDEEKKKAKNQSLNGARLTVGAKKSQFGKGLEITDREWKAIQAGAITDTKLQQIVANSDIDYLKKKSMPRTSSVELSPAKQAKIHSMINSGFSLKDIADDLGVSTSTVAKYAKGGN